MSDNTMSKKIKLKSSDGVEFTVSETVAKQSPTICRLIEDTSTENFIPLVNVDVTAPILAKVIEYFIKHVEAADARKTETTYDGSSTMPASSRISDLELRNWDKKFVDIDDATLYGLIKAANYLIIDGLLEVICRKMVDSVKDDDFIAEEEECTSRISGLSIKENC